MAVKKVRSDKRGKFMRPSGNKEVRRRRRKRKAMKRGLWMTLTVLAAAGLIFFGHEGYDLVTHHPMFEIKTLEVTGQHWATREEIRVISGVELGDWAAFLILPVVREDGVSSTIESEGFVM